MGTVVTREMEQREEALQLITRQTDSAQQVAVLAQEELETFEKQHEQVLQHKREKATQRSGALSLRRTVARLIAKHTSWQPSSQAGVRGKHFKSQPWEVILQREAVEQLFALPVRQRKLCLRSLLELSTGTDHKGLCHPIDLPDLNKAQDGKFDQLSVQQLKAYITQKGGNTAECFEKIDLVQLAEQLMAALPQEAPLKLRMAAAVNNVTNVAFVWEDSIDFSSNEYLACFTSVIRVWGVVASVESVPAVVKHAINSVNCGAG